LLQVRDLLATRSTHSDRLEIKHNDKAGTSIPGLLERAPTPLDIPCGMVSHPRGLVEYPTEHRGHAAAVAVAHVRQHGDAAAHPEDEELEWYSMRRRL
jgi:hypothetical protein